MIVSRPLLVLTLYLVSCTATRGSVAESGRGNGYGLTKQTAVEVCEPRGEREYLQRLRCGDGGAVPTFNRIGSVGSRNDIRTNEDERTAERQTLNDERVGPGEKDFHVVDGYEVACGNRTIEIFLDMYHCDRLAPDVAPPGFQIANSKD